MLPALLRRAPDELSPPVRLLRELYPLIWLGAFWPELDLLHQLHIPPTFDHQIAALDLALFGVHGTHVDLVWMWRMPYRWLDRKSTRLNSSHLVISYAVFCLKKKKKQ